MQRDEEDKNIARELRTLAKRVEEQDRLTAQERAELRWFRELWTRTTVEGLELRPAKTALVGWHLILRSVGNAHEASVLCSTDGGTK